MLVCLPVVAYIAATLTVGVRAFGWKLRPGLQGLRVRGFVCSNPRIPMLKPCQKLTPLCLCVRCGIAVTAALPLRFMWHCRRRGFAFAFDHPHRLVGRPSPLAIKPPLPAPTTCRFFLFRRLARRPATPRFLRRYAPNRLVFGYTRCLRLRRCAQLRNSN